MKTNKTSIQNAILHINKIEITCSNMLKYVKHHEKFSSYKFN